MSHSCIISEAKSALEVSEASEASAEGALAAAKLANCHVKKILAEDLEAVVAGDTGEEGDRVPSRVSGRDPVQIFPHLSALFTTAVSTRIVTMIVSRKMMITML